VSERKLGFFVQIKPPAWRAYAPEGKAIPPMAGLSLTQIWAKKTVFVQALVIHRKSHSYPRPWG